MAISKDQLTVEVVLDSSGAIKGIKDLQGQFVALDKVVSQSTKTTDKANQSTGKVGEAFAGLSSTLSKAALPLLAVQTAVTAVTQVFGVLSSALGSFVDDYAAAEKAQTLLTQAIENSNGRIQNSADAWGAYLDQLQEVKAVDADVLRGLVAQAVQMGFSEAQIKSLVEASIGLSKVTGDSLDGSFQKLIGTTKGMARGLTAMVPELQNLTDEQLRSGEAFAIVADKYKTAADGAGSYTYSVKQAGLAAGELSEDVGKLIVESINLKGAMDTATSVINGIRGAIAAVDMEALSKSFKEFMTVALPIGALIGGFTIGFTGLGAAITAAVAPIVLVTAKFALVAIGIAGVVAAIEILVRNFDLFDEALAMIASSIAFLFLKPLENAAYALRDFFSLFGDNAMTKAADQVFKGIEKAVNSLKDNVSKNFSSIKNNMDTGFSGQIVKQATNLMNGFSGEAKKADASLKALGATGSRVKVIDEKAIEAANNALKDIQKQTDALKLSAALTGQDEIAQIQIKATEQLRVIDLKEEELTKQGIINSKIKEALNDQRQAVIANANATVEMEKQKQQLEAQKGAIAALKGFVDDVAKKYQEAQMANLGTFDLIKAQTDAEMEKVNKQRESLELAEALTVEREAELEATKKSIIEIGNMKTGQAIMSGVNSAISAAQGGADALVGNIINQIGAAFGPQGQMIAGVVNLLRKGKEFTKDLGKQLVAIIADLPKMITEGAVGLIEGLVDGLMALLGNPKALEELINNIVMMIPKVVSALIRALPLIAIELSKPSFWITVVKTFVTSMIQGLGEMLKALRDAIKMAGKEIGKAAEKAVSDFFAGAEKIGNAVGDAFAAVGTFILDGIKSVGKDMGEFFASMGKDIWNGLKSLFGEIGSFFADIGKSIWEGLKAVWNELSSWFSGIGGKIWEGLKAVWHEITDMFGNIGKAIWDGLKNAIKSAGKTIAGWLGLSDGGIVGGYSLVSGDSPRNDTVPALLSPGEAVIPRSLMANPEIASMIKNLLNNREMPTGFGALPTFAIGGVALATAMGGGGSVVGDTNISVVVQIETTQQLDEAFIKQRLIPSLKNELKASSLRGDFVLSAKGVRS
jgi:hypothetical protein